MVSLISPWSQKRIWSQWKTARLKWRGSKSDNNPVDVSVYYFYYKRPDLLLRFNDFLYYKCECGFGLNGWVFEIKTAKQ